MNQPKIIETVTRVAPLGVRFLDSATGKTIGGLEVTARGEDFRTGTLTKPANKSDVYVLQNVPGLRDWEFGKGDAQFWAAALPNIHFVVEVNDPTQQFLPFTFGVVAPARGILEFSCTQNDPGGDVPLFSAANRSV